MSQQYKRYMPIHPIIDSKMQLWLVTQLEIIMQFEIGKEPEPNEEGATWLDVE
jgi:hypothetical protein